MAGVRRDAVPPGGVGCSRRGHRERVIIDCLQPRGEDAGSVRLFWMESARIVVGVDDDKWCD